MAEPNTLIRTFCRYSWTKDKVPVEFDDVTSQEGGNLLIREVSTDHSGSYKCTALNIHGSDTSTTRLTVTGKTHRMLGHPVYNLPSTRSGDGHLCIDSLH